MLTRLAVAALCACITTAVHGALATLHVGNSLTRDSRTESLVDTGRDLGWASARYARSSASLGWLLDHPGTPDFVEHGNIDDLDDALANHAWDAVTLQIHQPAPSSGLGLSLLPDDIAAVEAVTARIDAGRPADESKPTLFIHKGWAQRDDHAGWAGTFDRTVSRKTQNSRSYVTQLIDELEGSPALDDYTLKRVPTGDAFFFAVLLADAGAVPGLGGGDDLYRDNTHASYDAGRYLAHATLYSAITGLHPDTMDLSALHPADPILTVPQPTLDALGQIAWAVNTIDLALDAGVEQVAAAVVPEPGTAAISVAVAIVLAWRRR